jgi:hypothetical protein
MGEFIIIAIGLGILSWVFSVWSSARKECSQKIKEWKEKEKRIKELLSLPTSEDSNSLEVAQCHNCKRQVTINAKTKEKLQKALEEWKKYEDEVKLHKVASIFGLIIAVTNIILMIYEAFIFILDWKLPPALKPYEELMGGHLLFLGIGILGIAGVLIDPPSAPDEEKTFKTQHITGNEQQSSDSDEITLAAAGIEPYASIYGMKPSTHRD